MGLSKDDAISQAKRDLAERLGVAESEISHAAVENAEFPDMALGAAEAEEMSGQMMTSGWRIRLSAGDSGDFEYRANEDQLRLYNYNGSNYRI
jgi:hypothetical protein